MDTNFKSILYQYFFQDSIIFIIIFFVLLLIILIEIKKKKRIKIIIAELCILIFSFIGIVSIFVPVQLDISKNDIIQVGYSSGYLYTQSEHSELSLATPYYFKTDKGYNIELSVVDGMPNEIKNGTIVYSKRSKVLLKYTGETVKEW